MAQAQQEPWTDEHVQSSRALSTSLRSIADVHISVTDAPATWCWFLWGKRSSRVVNFQLTHRVRLWVEKVAEPGPGARCSYHVAWDTGDKPLAVLTRLLPRLATDVLGLVRDYWDADVAESSRVAFDLDSLPPRSVEVLDLLPRKHYRLISLGARDPLTWDLDHYVHLPEPPVSGPGQWDWPRAYVVGLRLAERVWTVRNSLIEAQQLLVALKVSGCLHVETYERDD